ncbi:hypothetical protein [Nocardioides aestuarii]|uniref:DUF4352 domain-containing protein n=1 Tax=Nocardioides aestuarii TaxID=252231 RepID=A0ABW4TJE6_9ACTN
MTALGMPAAEPGQASTRARRAAVGAVVAALLLVVGLGVWGLLAPRGHDDHPQVGELVAFGSGTFEVDAAYDVDLSAPMSGPAMTMGASSGVPDIPDGYRWVTVDLTIATTSDDGYVLDPSRFRVDEAGGGGADPPIDVDDGADTLPPGTEISRSFTYQVPEDATLLELWAPGAEEPVMLPLGDAPAPHGH